MKLIIISLMSMLSSTPSKRVDDLVSWIQWGVNAKSSLKICSITKMATFLLACLNNTHCFKYFPKTSYNQSRVLCNSICIKNRAKNNNGENLKFRLFYLMKKINIGKIQNNIILSYIFEFEFYKVQHFTFYESQTWTTVNLLLGDHHPHEKDYYIQHSLAQHECPKVNFYSLI